MAAAFAEAVRAAGGEVVRTETYPADATAFGTPVRQLAAAHFDALFVPDSGRALSLIAPALAAAGLWSTPAGAPAPRSGRAITLLAPSVAVDARVARASRYLQGALFATPFHAASADGRARAFTDAYRARFDEAPDAFAAFAYDAFELVERGVQAGRTTRGDLGRWLRDEGRSDTAGASGGLGPNRGPARSSQVLELRGDAFVPPGTAPAS